MAASITAQSFGGAGLFAPTTNGILKTRPKFSTSDYAGIADDRERVAAAVADAVAAIAATGQDQTVLIDGRMYFTTGCTQAALNGATNDPFDDAHPKQGVPLPVNLARTLRIEFAPGARIVLSSDCENAFYVDKLADYDVFRNVDFHDSWVDGANVPAKGHALIGNAPNGGKLMYLSFQDINFIGSTRFTNFYWDAGGMDEGQVGIAFYGEHRKPLEAKQTFSKGIYLEDGRMEGGGGLFCVTSIAAPRHRPGGCNHFYDKVVVGSYRYSAPSAPTSYANHQHTAIFICGAGFGDYAYIGPGHVENIGDDAIEIGAMQRVEIVQPYIRNPFYLGILLRQTHSPVDVASQTIRIRALTCEVTQEITKTPSAWAYPIRLIVDDQDIILKSTATGGVVTFTVPRIGTDITTDYSNSPRTTTEVDFNASASAIAEAFVAIGCTGTVASGGPLGTSPVTVKVGNVNLCTPVTFTPALTGGTLELDLAPSNASFGTIIIEDASFSIDGLTHSKHGRSTGLFVNGLDQPHHKVEVIRPKVVLANYVYDTGTSDDLSLYYPVAPYAGWGHFVLRDHNLRLQGTCDFQKSTGQGTLYEVNVGGQNTNINIDGMTNDRAASVNGKLYQVVVGLVAGSETRAAIRRLFPRTLAKHQTNGGVRLFGVAPVAQFDVFDCDFSQGTTALRSIDLSSAGSNADVPRSGDNLYPPSS